MWTARQIAFLEPDVVEHPLDERDVLGLAAVRRARHRQLLVTPAQLVERAGAEKREDLKGLGAGAPVGECVAIAGGAEQLIAFPDYGGVYTMFGFDPVTAGDCYIQFVRLDHAE